MGLGLLVGGGLAAALAAGELPRSAVLGDRMARSFETLKVKGRDGVPCSMTW
jgi:hypothetical protein